MQSRRDEFPGYIPFGAQYYRAPTPLSQEWERDLDQFRAQGFNTIKLWAQWRWNNPAPGEYDLSDLDRLMDLAGERSLKVVINTIFDVAPVWIYRDYPDCRLTTADGRKLGPWTGACRQIGGWPGPCLNHPEAHEARMAFLAAVAERYASHEALIVWDVWNEPELSVCTARDGRIWDQVCFCDNCRQEFLAWLQSRYGDLAGLNAAWQRNYREWDDVELPIMPATHGDMIDWRLFHVDVMAREERERVAVVKRYDQTHPVMCHTVPMPIFNVIHAGSDDWALAEPGDWHGNSLGSDPFAADVIVSAARGRTVINAEIHALPGSSLARPHPLSMQDMQRHLLTPLAHGIKGFLFWQYRPELLGTEAPAWGLTQPDGSPAPWLEHARTINAMIQQDGEFFWHACPEGPQVHVLFSPESHIFNWCAQGSFQIYDDALRGIWRSLHQANYRVGFVHVRELDSEVMRAVDVLYAPFLYVLDQAQADALRRWVSDGGTLIGEAWFGNLQRENSLHSQRVPGYGFDEVFGVVEGVNVPFSAAANLYASQFGVDTRGVGPLLTLTEPLGHLEPGAHAEGYLIEAPLHPSQASVLARWRSGEAAITDSRYGAGRALLCGTLLSTAAQHTPTAASLVAALARHVGVESPMHPKWDGRLRVDVLERGGRRAICLTNTTGEPIHGTFRWGELPAGPLMNVLTGEVIAASENGWAVDLDAGQVEMFWLEKD